MSEQGGKHILLKSKKGVTGAVTFQNTGDTVTKNGHGFKAGDKVKFTNVVTTTTITGTPEYFVINPTTNTFQVSLTLGGTAVLVDADGTGDLVDVFQIIGGLRSKSIGINAEAIDITTHDSLEWKKILDAAGLRSVSLSGAGVFENGNVVSNIRSKMMSNTLQEFEVIVTDAGDKFTGTFKVTSLEYSGDYNGESQYSLSMESSGEVTFTAA